MKAKDKSDGMSKEGCGRVAALKITKTMYCYTVEANYYTGKNINEIPQIGLEDEYTNNHSGLYMGQVPDFNPGVLADCGRALLISYLDLIECNPLSRLRQSTFQNLLQLRISIAEKLITQLPYRLYSYLRKMQSNKQHLTKYIQTGKVDPECFPCFSNEEPARSSKKKKHKSRTKLPQLITKKNQETSQANAQNQNIKNAKDTQRQINTIAVHQRKSKNSSHFQNNKSNTPSIWNVVLQKRKSNKG